MSSKAPVDVFRNEMAVQINTVVLLRRDQIVILITYKAPYAMRFSVVIGTCRESRWVLKEVVFIGMVA